MKFSIENGCFAYDASRTILQDVCVQLDGAEILTVLGSNGHADEVHAGAAEVDLGPKLRRRRGRA